MYFSFCLLHFHPHAACHHSHSQAACSQIFNYKFLDIKNNILYLFRNVDRGEVNYTLSTWVKYMYIRCFFLSIISEMTAFYDLRKLPAVYKKLRMFKFKKKTLFCMTSLFPNTTWCIIAKLHLLQIHLQTVGCQRIYSQKASIYLYMYILYILIL